ncbi:hypothetical protein [Campylobacter sp.]|nr:hypothetical protein [uncultured Campylobacter sp.]
MLYLLIGGQICAAKFISSKFHTLNARVLPLKFNAMPVKFKI